ncbi:MAG: sodium:calcium antiporter [Candidatus Bathyarchaeia archaeon]
MLDFVLAAAALISGLALLIFASDKAVEHSINVASMLKVSPLMIGLLIVSLGTDLPEIANSIFSSFRRHGDINVGDSFGSVLAQISLMLGLYAILARESFKVRRDEIIVIGACEILALIASIAMVEKGYISWMNAVFLVASWPLLMLIVRRTIRQEPPPIANKNRGLFYHLLIVTLGYAGVAVGSYVVVESVIAISSELNIHEYIISFFIVSIGTSLPELAVDLTAVRKRQYEIAIGDAIGSCIVDAGFSIGIGPFFFAPVNVSGRIAETTGLYALLVSVIVLATLAFREKVDKKAGALFVALYLFSYVTLYLS